MSQTFEIPLSPTPQSFTIVLAGRSYLMTVRWSKAAQIWVLDIANAEQNMPILYGMFLVTGIDLFRQFGYLNFGGQLFCETDNNALAPPTFDNLGIAGRVYFTVIT